MEIAPVGYNTYLPQAELLDMILANGTNIAKFNGYHHKNVKLGIHYAK